MLFPRMPPACTPDATHTTILAGVSQVTGIGSTTIAASRDAKKLWQILQCSESCSLGQSECVGGVAAPLSRVGSSEFD